MRRSEFGVQRDGGGQRIFHPLLAGLLGCRAPGCMAAMGSLTTCPSITHSLLPRLPCGAGILECASQPATPTGVATTPAHSTNTSPFGSGPGLRGSTGSMSDLARSAARLIQSGPASLPARLALSAPAAVRQLAASHFPLECAWQASHPCIAALHQASPAYSLLPFLVICRCWPALRSRAWPRRLGGSAWHPAVCRCGLRFCCAHMLMLAGGLCQKQEGACHCHCVVQVEWRIA